MPSACVLKQRDTRIDCDSLIIATKVGPFIQLIRQVYSNRGGIEGQRGDLKTKSALTIRQRLVDDLIDGAVIPPITIGILVNSEQRELLWSAENAERAIQVLQTVDTNQLSIIDGMQRTTAYIEAMAKRPNIEEQEIRVELWSSERINGLIYRMLVLNSGQIPWETARQLETIYSQFIRQLQSGLSEDVELFLKDDGRRRTAPGQFQASTVVRLFLAFSARRAEFDLKDRVAEDFAKIDAIESSSHDEFFEYFRETLRLLLQLDRQFSRYIRDDVPYGVLRIRDGREIFKSEPALIGFFVAVAIKLFDVPGFEVNWERAKNAMTEVVERVMSLVGRLSQLDSDELVEFLELGTLNERLDRRSGQIGRFERDLFTRAFSLLIERGDALPNFRPCWLQ